MRAALALAVLVFHPALRECFELPRAAVVRAAGIGLFLFVLLRRRAAAWTTAFGAAVLAWLASEALATLASRSPLLSTIGEPMQREGLLTSLALAGFALAASRSDAPAGADRGDAAPEPVPVTATVAWMIAAVSLSCLYALAQSAGLDPIRWEGSASYAAAGAALERPSGTFGHPNLLGVMSAAAAVASLALAIAAPRRRVPLALAAALAGATTLVTLSRAAWLALLLGTLVAVPLATRAAGVRPKRAWLAAAAGVAAIAAILLATGWGPRLAARAAEWLSPASGTGASRLEIWRSAIAQWRSRPWLGTGPDTFALLVSRFQTPAYWRFEWAGVPYHAHSIVLHELATRGLLGLAACLVWAVALLGAARSAWRAHPGGRGTIAAVLASLAATVVAGMFGALGIAGALWLAIGSASLASLAAGPRTGGAGPASRAGHGLAAVVALGAGSVVALLSLSDLLGSAAAREADVWLAAARRDGDAAARARAFESAGQAVRANPLEDGFHRLRSDAWLGAVGLVAAGGQPLAGAEASARRAVSLEPLRVENHEQVARVLAARAVTGDRSAAGQAHGEIDRVVADAPANALLLGECARIELLLGEPARARAIAERVAARYPDHAPALALIAESELALGDRAAAAATLRRAFAGTWRGDSVAYGAALDLAGRLR